MKRYRFHIIFLLVMLMGSIAQAQHKTDPGITMIDVYFSNYSNLPKYKVTTMNERMIEHSNKVGMWTHPAFARIMKQVKLYKFLNFDSSVKLSAEIVSKLSAAVKKDKLYEEYYRASMSGAVSTLIYTKGVQRITEITYITIDSKHMHISCFVGDNIDIESIRTLAPKQ
jgi:hypothetical protein